MPKRDGTKASSSPLPGDPAPGASLARPATPYHLTTTTTLLDALHDPANDAVWSAFDRRYRPIIEAVGVRMGLSREDAADAAQQTLADFVRDFRAGKYERGRGRLGGWIMGIARNRVMDMRRNQARRRERRGDSAIRRMDAGDEVARAFEAERRRTISVAAMEELRRTTRSNERTIRAFEMVVLQDVSPAAAAQECGMSVEEVYVAKNRIAKRLREIVARLTKAYDEDA